MRGAPIATCTERTALAPSPTAAATRFMDPWRTSPTAKTAGTLVSKGSGERPSAGQATARSSGPSCTSVRMNPSSSRAMPVSQAAAGSAPMKQNSPLHGLVSSCPVTRLVSVMRSSARPPWSRVTSVDSRRSIRGSVAIRSTRYRDIPAAISGPRIANVTELSDAARASAAWPAEFAPPTTVTGRPTQCRTSRSVAA